MGILLQCRVLLLPLFMLHASLPLHFSLILLLLLLRWPLLHVLGLGWLHGLLLLRPNPYPLVVGCKAAAARQRNTKAGQPC